MPSRGPRTNRQGPRGNTEPTLSQHRANPSQRRVNQHRTNTTRRGADAEPTRASQHRATAAARGAEEEQSKIMAQEAALAQELREIGDGTESIVAYAIRLENSLQSNVLSLREQRLLSVPPPSSNSRSMSFGCAVPFSKRWRSAAPTASSKNSGVTTAHGEYEVRSQPARRVLSSPATSTTPLCREVAGEPARSSATKS